MMLCLPGNISYSNAFIDKIRVEISLTVKRRNYVFPNQAFFQMYEFLLQRCVAHAQVNFKHYFPK